MKAFVAHGVMTSPGKHAPAIAALPDDVPSLLDAIQGLLVHIDSLEFYDLDATEDLRSFRDTLPLERRLERILRKSSDPLAALRSLEHRDIGTCRDYAVMACGMLREKSVPARVRCGFARYFHVGRFEDHWICEYWRADDARWARADAQLDDRHRDRLGTTFDPSDVPDREFLTAKEAWALVREIGVSADLFGHGDATGEWFLWVNLARDYLSLAGQETSEWDTWRQSTDNHRQLNDTDRSLCDAIVEGTHILEQHRRKTDPTIQLQPFWLDTNS